MFFATNLLKGLQSSRQTGNKCYSRHVLSLLLEQYESSVYDEYCIEGEDEGSSVPPLACEFSKGTSSSDILGLVDENGYVVIYNTNKYGQQAIIKDWRAHSNAIFDLAWMKGDDKLLTAAGDQTIVLWDVPTGKKINCFQGHTSSVRSVNFKTNDSAVFVTGSRDGHVMVWDVRCNKKGFYSSPVQVIRNAHSIPHLLKAKRKPKLGPSRDSQQSVTIVVYQTDTTLLSAGAVDGCVKMWDLRKSYSASADPVAKHTFNYSGLNKRSHGYSSLVLDSSHTQLFASCTDDIIYQYNLLTLDSKPVACFKGHQNKSFYVKAAISPDDQFLLSGSSNEMAYIWKIDKPNESPVVLKGHNAEVTDVSWNSSDCTKLATLSDDNTMRIWRVNRRLSPRESREITGYSERTHREIGITASQPSEVTPCKMPCTPKTVSPSILHFLNKSAQKSGSNSPSLSANTISNTMNGKAETSKVIVNGPVNETRENTTFGTSCLPCPKEKVNVTNDTHQSDNNSSDGRSRLPCKRKLVCDYEDDENPRKRQNVGDLDCMVSSPNRTGHTQNIVKSPWKCDENPQKWLHASYQVASPIGSPRRKCEVLKEMSTTDNSPSKCIGSSPIAVPAHVKTKLFEQVQSPTINLPNLVVEGTVKGINVNSKKCDKENSPKKSKIDWLTKKRLEKESECGVLLRKDSNSPKLNKMKDNSLLRKESNSHKVNKMKESGLRKELSSPRISKKNMSNEEVFPRKDLGSPHPDRDSNSQEDGPLSRQMTPKGMKSLKHYFSVK